MAIDRPGLYDLPAAEYHADPCPEPSFSSSIGKLILNRSPLHGAIRHPRIAIDPIHDEKDIFDLGNAAHTLLLGDGREFEIVDKANWQGNVNGVPSAKFKSDTRAAGKIPILIEQYERTLRMVDACHAQLAESESRGAFLPGSGKGEQALIWQEGDVWCRALLDWHPNDFQFSKLWHDYKTTTGSAHPDDWGGRTGWGLQFDFQAAFYTRGIRAVFGIAEPQFRFVVQEREEPHCICLVQLTPAAVAMAQRKVDRALQIWRECRAKNLWPGYPARVCYVDPPPHEERRWLEREEREPMDPNMVERLLDWQRPYEGFH